MSRFEEVVNEAIGEVVLRRVDVQGRDARRAHRAARARPPGRAARRGHRRGALPRAQAGAGLGHPDAGALHAARLGARDRARHPPADRRHRPGDDRVPVRAGAGRRRARASGSRSEGFDADEIERILEAVPVATHNQRGLGTLHIGCTELCDDEIDAATLLRDRRAVDVVGDLRADEALRRGARRREGPPPPAVRRGLRARDDPRRGRRASRRSTTARSSPRAR